MQNLLAEYTPEFVQELEEKAREREEFGGSIHLLREAYRTSVIQSAISGNDTCPDRVQVWTSLSKEPYFRSHYAQWIQMLPFRDVEDYANNLLRQREKYPHLIRARGNKKNMDNNAQNGIIPISVLLRPPLSLDNDNPGPRELQIGRNKIGFVFHVSPKGIDAKNGFIFSEYRGYRIKVGDMLIEKGLKLAINSVIGSVLREVQWSLEEGYYDESLECLFGNMNDIVERWWKSGI